MPRARLTCARPPRFVYWYRSSGKWRWLWCGCGNGTVSYEMNRGNCCGRKRNWWKLSLDHRIVLILSAPSEKFLEVAIKSSPSLWIYSPFLFILHGGAGGICEAREWHPKSWPFRGRARHPLRRRVGMCSESMYYGHFFDYCTRTPWPGVTTARPAHIALPGHVRHIFCCVFWVFSFR